MEDFDFLTSEFDRYIIGFTENQYSKSKDKSPSPVDQTPRHSSLAYEYAERSNKVAENIFQDLSQVLDRKKTRSMNKINGNKLDLVFELTERRKNSLPLQRSFNSDLRPESRMSSGSIEMEELSSSPTFPTIQVQQLPPLFQPMERLPILPDINIEQINVIQKQKKKKKSTKENDNNENNNMNNRQSTNFVKTPKILDVVKQVQKVHKLEHETKLHEQKVKTNGDTGAARNEVNSENNESPITLVTNIKENPSVGKATKVVRWQNVTSKLVDTMKEIGENPDNFNVYRRHNSISRGSGGHFRMSSFCQSSYQERADRERAYNTRRRHLLQTKTGPLDFNKLRRQISFGRSNTTTW